MEEKKVTVNIVESREKCACSRKNKVRVAVYCRVSTEHEEQEGSFEMQRAAFEDKVSRTPGQILAGVYGDFGKSGGSRKYREQFNKMLQDCHEGKIDLIMTKSISRFARNLADTTECIRELKTLGIPVYFEKENLNTMDASAGMVISMLAAIAQEEMNNHSRNIKWSFCQRARAGSPVRSACYGYRRKKNGEWKIYEPEAKKVRLIFQMASEENLYRELLDMLNRMEQEEGSSYVWNRNRVYWVLKKEEYIGDVLTHKKVSVDYLAHKQVSNRGIATQYYIKDHHEPIIKRETFHKVQNILRKRSRRKSFGK